MPETLSGEQVEYANFDGALPVRGERGGARVIYFARTHKGEIWMLTIYAKSEADSIPANVLRKIRKEIDG